MENTTHDCFAVVQNVYQLEDWQMAAALLTEVLGLPAVTARQQARKSHGYLAAHLPGELARRLRDACAARGIGVQVVPQSDVVPVIKPVRMHEVRIADDALRLRATGLDATMLLGWDTLRLDRRYQDDPPGIVPALGGRQEVWRLKVTTYTEDYAEYLADLFAVQPHGEVLGDGFCRGS